MINSLEDALQKHQKGKLHEALRIYKELLSKNPNHIQVLILTGKLYLTAKKPNVALPFFKRANDLAPNTPDITNYIGKTYIQMKRLKEARSLFETLLKSKDRYIPALLNLAKIEKDESNFNEAIHLYQKVLLLKPDSETALNNLGNIFQGQGKHQEAIEYYQKAIRLNPDNAKLRMNYGNILLLENKLESSLVEYKKALSIDRKLMQVYKNLVELYSRLYPYEKALTEIEKIFKSGVRIPEILLSAAILAINNKDFKLAINLLKKNVELFPDHFDSLYQLGISYHQSAFFKKAHKVYEKAYEINNESDLLLYAMAKVYIDLKEDEKSLEYLEKAIKINPENYTAHHELIRTRLNTCDWSKRDEDKKKLQEISLKQIELSTPSPIPFLNLNYFEQENSFLLKCSEHSANNSKQKTIKNKVSLTFEHKPSLNSKLKIGYISPDFRDHPTGRVTVDFISAHTKDQFEIFCFSLIADLPKDKIQDKFKKVCDHYISLYNVPTEKAAKIIYDYQIDILVDIAGYTTYSRPEIMALQPAPIQCQMIGFPGTMGAPFIQYIIADDVLVPNDHEKYYTEKIVRLPNGFPGSILDVNDEINSREYSNLPDDKFIYCCFNSQYKYSPEIFDAWMEILHQVPNSVLLLKGGNEVYQNNIQKEARQRNMDESRIYFGDNLPFPDYMARNKVCDLFLDTLFYTAGSTAINALQVGLPVLTCLGNTNASCMGASIVNATGFQHLICNDLDEYINKAINFGNNPKELKELKSKLKNSVLKSNLFNVSNYDSWLEQAYMKMWKNYMDGKLPELIEIKK